MISDRNSRKLEEKLSKFYNSVDLNTLDTTIKDTKDRLAKKKEEYYKKKREQG